MIPRGLLRQRVAALIVYAALAMIALFPLLRDASTHTGGEWVTDYYHFHWNYWWMRHALATDQHIYATDYVLSPAVTNLAYHTLTPAWYPVWALIEPVVGTLAAMQAIQWLAMTLTGYCLFVFLRDEGAAIPLALIGGVLFMLASGMRLAAMLTTINYVSMFWLPLCLSLWRRTATDGGRAAILWAVALGMALYGVLMTDYQLILFLAFAIIPYGVWTLLIAKRPARMLAIAARGGAAIAIALTLFAIAGPLRDLIAFDRASLSPMSIEFAAGIPFPDGYISRFDTFNRAITLGSLLLPLTAISLVIAVIRRTGDRRLILWTILLIPPLVLSAGAVITIGDRAIDLPYRAFHALFDGMFRSPSRFEVVIVIACTVILAIVWTPLIARLSRIGRSALTGALLLAVVIDTQILSAPIPTQPITPPYAFYAAIGEETGDPYGSLVVLTVPVAGGSGEAWVGDFAPMQAQFYGMSHGKRMLNGSIARAPLTNFWHWLYDDPLLAWLGQRRLLEDAVAQEELDARIDAGNVGYIVVHRDWIGREQPAVVEVIGWLNSQPDRVCPLLVERDAVLYRTRAHPDGCPPITPPRSDDAYTIMIGANDDALYLGWGWHYAEDIFGTTLRWLGAPRPDDDAESAPRADLHVDLPAGEFMIEVDLQAYHEDRRVDLRIDGVPVLEGALVPSDGVITVNGVFRTAGGRHTLTIAADAARSPASLDAGTDARPLAVMVTAVRLIPR